MRKLILTLATLLFFISCTEEIDTSARYVFTEYTVASYLEAHEDYSQYVELTKLVPVSGRSQSSVYQLLTARGNYTCFALTNKAINAYLQDLVKEGLISEPSWDAFPDERKLDSIRKVVVLNTVINGGDMEEQRFTTSHIIAFSAGKENAEFPLPNIYDHKLTVGRDSKNNKNDTLYLDKVCAVDPRNCDIPVINGVIHKLHKVIAPKDESCARYLQNILDKGEATGYLMFAKALQACGLLDTLSKVRDEAYEALYQAEGDNLDMKDYESKGGSDMSRTADDPDAHAPEHRKYGFTLFCETDDFWQLQGIDPTASDAVEKLQEWIDGQMDGKIRYLKDGYLGKEKYVVNTDYTSPKNMLHQWVTYHILPMKIPANKLVYHCNELGYSYSSPSRYTIPVMEWYPVFGTDHRLIKIYESPESEGIYLNRFPVRNNGITEDGHESQCDEDKKGILILTNSDKAVLSDIVNACIYPLEEPLAYTEEVRDNLGRERIRFDLFSLFPEAITNGIRRADSPLGKWQHVFVSLYNRYNYFDNMTILNSETHLIHYNGYKTPWANYSGDEDKAFGQFDIMFKLPPVPKRNTYEFRYKLLATAARGIVQVYFGNDPDRLPVAGIPINMTHGVVLTFGEEATWGDLQDSGKEEDEIIEIDHKLRNHGLMKATKHETEMSATTARAKENCCRHIIVRQTLDPSETYYVRFKSVLSDLSRKELYLDYFEYCPKEIYDSPETPEDIW